MRTPPFKRIFLEEFPFPSLRTLNKLNNFWKGSPFDRNPTLQARPRKRFFRSELPPRFFSVVLVWVLLLDEACAFKKWRSFFWLKICKERNIPCLFLQGYKIDWPDNSILEQLDIDLDFVIEDFYKESDFYILHDHDNNTVPCKEFQKHFAFMLNDEWLKHDLDQYYNKFAW